MKKEIKEGFQVKMENETFKLETLTIYPKEEFSFQMIPKADNIGYNFRMDNKSLSDMINILMELKEEIEMRHNPETEEEKKQENKEKLPTLKYRKNPLYFMGWLSNERDYLPEDIIEIEGERNVVQYFVDKFPYLWCIAKEDDEETASKQIRQ